MSEGLITHSLIILFCGGFTDMNPIFVAGLILCMLITPAAAFSGTDISTSSLLISSGSDLSVLRSISQNQITTPDLNLITNAIITSSASMEGGGSALISQNALYSASSNIDGLYAGRAYLGSSVSATGIMNIDSSIYFTGSSVISNPWGDLESMSKVEAECFGMGIASPGTGNYGFSLGSSQNTYSNGMILKNPSPKTETNIYSISLVPDSIQFEEPVDSMEEDLDLEFTLSDGNLDGFSYDFSRDIEIDNVEFFSQMTYGKWGEVV